MKKEKVKTISIIILSFLLALSVSFGFYNYGFKRGYEGRIEYIIDFYEAWDLDVEDLQTDNFSGIKLYSDIEDFEEIKYFMADLNISNETYPYLHGIAYYQNSSLDCEESSYDDNFKNVKLYRCKENMSLHKLSIKKEELQNLERENFEFDEKFILAHELGHYLFDIGGSIEEEICADNYAKKLLNNKGVKDDGGF